MDWKLVGLVILHLLAVMLNYYASSCITATEIVYLRFLTSAKSPSSSCASRQACGCVVNTAYSDQRRFIAPQSNHWLS